MLKEGTNKILHLEMHFIFLAFSPVLDQKYQDDGSKY